LTSFKAKNNTTTIKLTVFESLMSVEPLHKFPVQQYDVPVYRLDKLKAPDVQLYLLNILNKFYLSITFSLTKFKFIYNFEKDNIKNDKTRKTYFVSLLLKSSISF
jgi:hypothetical protein